jgi:hypothetical protein
MSILIAIQISFEKWHGKDWSRGMPIVDRPLRFQGNFSPRTTFTTPIRAQPPLAFLKRVTPRMQVVMCTKPNKAAIIDASVGVGSSGAGTTDYDLLVEEHEQNQD